MRRYAVTLALLAALLLCCGLVAAEVTPQVAAPLTLHLKKPVFAPAVEKHSRKLDDRFVKAQLPEVARLFFANEKESVVKGTATQEQQQQQQHPAQQMESVAAVTEDGKAIEGAHEDAKELRAIAAHVSASTGPHSVHLRHLRHQQMSRTLGRGAALVLAVDDTTNKTTNTSSPASKHSTAAEEYVTVLSGGVIASVTIALVFACALLVLVLIEMVTSIAEFVEHRRVLASHKSRISDDPAEPKYGDFRDTAVNLQV
ncbi:hypothetical protein ABB37_01533 [Leptomonas pyrrhocoris]|uniref:Transmembrane protein n=1 Tax=Leptomonas pyrrhocoris TaxID=157538 RepID=A0A0M9G970_LEPPY|nr:hypothetical protein ABB37_01533 [Leptomonas pyrrhocoris]XP_015663596.1 hypothetical protein ABB37_01533 [Leptomonas pyrrhocoris]KPA85156.1 hypothetical protein ABB37_01533 [Leptomonas pyrrhocoris]KPA85157.1 hypothetical protein ABB37_01533 [Leptomonas pyrrhocoris]|eukprot:XP_015663595.1 hypothetical protein ABB37_01533 [Leptomonas pyrrhocoris]